MGSTILKRGLFGAFLLCVSILFSLPSYARHGGGHGGHRAHGGHHGHHGGHRGGHRGHRGGHRGHHGHGGHRGHHGHRGHRGHHGHHGHHGHRGGWGGGGWGGGWGGDYLGVGGVYLGAPVDGYYNDCPWVRQCYPSGRCVRKQVCDYDY